jgi:hypothetical protein
MYLCVRVSILPLSTIFLLDFRNLLTMCYLLCFILSPSILDLLYTYRGRRGRHRMVVGFTTTNAINAYHHYRCEFESQSGEVYSIQHYVIKFVSDLQQVGGFLWVLRFPPPIKLTATI